MNEEKEDSPALKKMKEKIMQLSYEDKLLLLWYIYDEFWKSLEQQRVAKQVMDQDKEALSKLSES